MVLFSSGFAPWFPGILDALRVLPKVSAAVLVLTAPPFGLASFAKPHETLLIASLAC
jgi:hypothetical protein